jgi:hypothetical protein
MTLWLPLLDYARSDIALVQRIMRELPAGACAHGYQLNAEQSTALRFHGDLQLKPVDQDSCQWLITTPEAVAQLGAASGPPGWIRHAQHQHPVERDDEMLIYRRISTSDR